MRGFKGRTARAACVAALVALTGAAPAFAAVELDQNAIVVDDGQNVISVAALIFGTSAGGPNPTVYSSLVQSVTAGKTGFLDHIDVQLARQQTRFPLQGTMTFRLYDGDLTAGPATLITSQIFDPNDLTIIANEVPTDFFDFDVRAANFLVTSGQMFSFSLDFVSTSGLSEVVNATIGLVRYIPGQSQAPTTDFNLYAGGQLNIISSAIGGNGAEVAGDAGFRTFVDVQGGAVPEPASWALMIGGFALAGGALRRRKSETLRFA